VISHTNAKLAKKVKEIDELSTKQPKPNPTCANNGDVTNFGTSPLLAGTGKFLKARNSNYATWRCRLCRKDTRAREVHALRSGCDLFPILILPMPE
jgi:hypothetical protein